MNVYKFTTEELQALKEMKEGERIRFFRTKAGLLSNVPENFNLVNFATKLDITYQTLLNLEKSLFPLSFDYAMKISSTLGIPIQVLSDYYYASKEIKPFTIKVSSFKVSYTKNKAENDLLTKKDYSNIRNMTLGEKIHYIRKLKSERYSKKYYTLESVAQRAGLTTSAYYHIESGKSKNPEFTTMCGISQALGVPLYVLANKNYSLPVRIKLIK